MTWYNRMKWANRFVVGTVILILSYIAANDLYFAKEPADRIAMDLVNWIIASKQYTLNGPEDFLAGLGLVALGYLAMWFIITLRIIKELDEKWNFVSDIYHTNFLTGGEAYVEKKWVTTLTQIQRSRNFFVYLNNVGSLVTLFFILVAGMAPLLDFVSFFVMFWYAILMLFVLFTGDSDSLSFTDSQNYTEAKVCNLDFLFGKPEGA